MAKVSVIIYAGSESKHLQESVDSFFSQDCDSSELIIVSGEKRNIQGLTDNYRSRLLLSPYNFGMAKSLNAAMLYCEGQHIAVQYADDISLPNRISVQTKYLDQHSSVDLVSCNAIIIGSTGQQIGFYAATANDTLAMHEAISRRRQMPVLHASFMYRKDVVLQYGGYNDNDSGCDLLCRLLSFNCQAANIPEPLIRHRGQPTNSLPPSVVAQFRRRHMTVPKIQPAVYGFIDVLKASEKANG
jgi:glycosyltransferase involved in cell wall biosynthesis